MSTLTLQYVEEKLRRIISSYTLDDWEEQGETLTRIRELTLKPRKRKVGRPQRGPVKESARSLEELLKLPDSGQVSSGETEPTLAILENEKCIIKYCRDTGLKQTAISVVTAVFRSLDRPRNTYANVWHGCSQFYKAKGTTASRLLDTEDTIVGEAHINGARYRINALLFAFDFRARCQMSKFAHSTATKNKETAVIRQLMKESKKTSEQIRTLLKRGRFYMQWVNELGVGAILVLGESLASNNYMTTIDHLIKICKSIPGFCKHSRNLSEPAREAIVQAMIMSGQAAPVTEQRYISYSGTPPVRSGDRIESTNSGIPNDQTCHLPRLQEVTQQSPQRRPTSTCFPMLSLTAMGRQGQDVLNLQPPWRPDATLVRAYENTSETAYPRQNVNLTEADKGLLQPRAADYPEPQAQTYLSENQNYGDMGGRDPAWDGVTHNTQVEEWDVGFWGANFSF